jgi:hypothetical protein
MNANYYFWINRGEGNYYAGIEALISQRELISLIENLSTPQWDPACLIPFRIQLRSGCKSGIKYFPRMDANGLMVPSAMKRVYAKRYILATLGMAMQRSDPRNL